jgi:hypothetical protein
MTVFKWPLLWNGTFHFLYFQKNWKTIFIEYECNGKPSGISSTTSDYYFYFFHKPDETYVAYEIPIENLKKACIGSREILKAGDGGRVKAYIVPVIEEFRL